MCHPLLRRYALRRVRLPVGAATLSLVLPDASDWIRRGEWADATEAGAEPPYWVQVWPAAVAAARLLARAAPLTGKRVLDLGCGLGVPGIAAAHAGAAVTFADQQPDALAFASWNAAQLASAAPPLAHAFDWSHTTIDGRFDVLVLADVTYRPAHHVALQRHVRACLADDGVVLHADPWRREATPFVRWLQQHFATAWASRATAALARRTDVRLCMAARTAGLLDPWRRAMGALPAPDAAPAAGSA